MAPTKTDTSLAIRKGVNQASIAAKMNDVYKRLKIRVNLLDQNKYVNNDLYFTGAILIYQGLMHHKKEKLFLKSKI